MNESPEEPEDSAASVDPYATEVPGHSTVPTSGDFQVSEDSPESFGPYRVRQKIGEGGMGAVYLADQEQPIRRQVALKIIRADRGDSDQIVARFEAERQALALMDHPNIARVLDGGQAEDGTPYFAMEFVNGIPLTQYCDQRRLSIDDRLRLFIPICRAIQHAHQKGIIHRDLKPFNVLVTEVDGKPVPKVIDFGLAKATDRTARLTDKTMFTQMGQLLGTVQYMSPEQAELDQFDIDTRTDIYSLGVMLYELLTGTTPLDEESLAGRAIFKVLERIREEDPERPSTRLSGSGNKINGVSSNRRIASGKLQQILRGELDWIVMKSLEIDRSRRYATPNDFAADIQRYLAQDPVLARPPSLKYQLSKRLRKYRVAAAVASTFMLIVFAALTTVTFLYLKNEGLLQKQRELTEEKATLARLEQEQKLKAQAAQEIAEVEAKNQRLTTDFLLDMFGAGDPLFSKVITRYSTNSGSSLGEVVSAATALELDDANTTLSERPVLRAELLVGLGEVSLSNGELHLAQSAFRKAEELLHESEEDVSVRQAELATIAALVDLYFGDMQAVIQRLNAAAPTLRLAVEQGTASRRTVRGLRDIPMLLGLAHLELDQLDDAQRQFELMAASDGTAAADDLRRLAGEAFALGVLREKMLRDDMSDFALAPQFLVLTDKALGLRGTVNANIYNALLSAIQAMGLYKISPKFAIARLEGVHRSFEETLGKNHILNAVGYFFMFMALEQTDLRREALSYSTRMLDLMDQELGERKHPILCLALRRRAKIIRELHQFDPQGENPSLDIALADIDEALQLGVRVFGEQDWQVGKCIYERGRIRLAQGQYDAAIGDFDRAFHVLSASLGQGSKTTGHCLREKATAFLFLKQRGKAMDILRRRISLLKEHAARPGVIGRAQLDLAKAIWTHELGQSKSVATADQLQELRTNLAEALQNLEKNANAYPNSIATAEKLIADLE